MLGLLWEFMLFSLKNEWHWICSMDLAFRAVAQWKAIWRNLMAKILGIDLGTTNSCMSVMDGGEATVLENSEGKRTTPSVVAFGKGGERLVGDAAKRQAVTNPANTIYSAKRFIGRKFNEVKEESKRMPYNVVSGSNGDAAIEVDVDGKKKAYSPQELASMVLAKLKADAEMRLGESITQAVITVPAYFNDTQRQATKDAGKIAGLEVLRIINEPTAASLAYGLDKKNDEKIAVYDLGGGTFDISILEIGDKVFEVKATNGDTHLGGDDWDNAIIDWVAAEFKIENSIDLTGQPDAMQRIKEEAEKAKIALSSTQTYEISLPFITADQSGPKHIKVELTRAKLEQLTDNLFERTTAPVKACMRDAELSSGQIDELVLVGGMTRMPRVVDTAKALLGKQPNQGVNPDEVVAIGAAIQGGVLNKEEGLDSVLLLDVTPLSLGIETEGGIFTKLIERNTTVPAKKSNVFSTAADNQPAVDVVVFQGERPMANDNKKLGNFKLDGIDSAPRGMPQIEVSFDIDANGILHVSAKDKKTGKEQRITIKDSSGLSDDEIEQMKREAEENADADKERQEQVEARNQADTGVYAAEKLLKENAEKLSDDTKTNLEKATENLKEALAGDDLEAITGANEKLQEAMQTAGAEVYKATTEAEQAEGGQPEDGENSEKKDEGPVVDAEVVEEEKA
jgi:molecular chaperone DnaK